MESRLYCCVAHAVVRMRDASLAAWMASSQYSWCSPADVVRSLKLHSRRNLSSSAQVSGPRVSWYSISFSRSSLWVEIRVPLLRLWTRTHQKIHWLCVTWRSCVMKPEIHRVAWNDELLSVKCELWIQKSLIVTIPIAKLSHPMTSCDLAKSWKIWGRFRAI
jgi:hypothetical protein